MPRRSREEGRRARLGKRAKPGLRLRCRLDLPGLGLRDLGASSSRVLSSSSSELVPELSVLLLVGSEVGSEIWGGGAEAAHWGAPLPNRLWRPLGTPPALPWKAQEGQAIVELTENAEALEEMKSLLAPPPHPQPQTLQPGALTWKGSVTPMRMLWVWL